MWAPMRPHIHFELCAQARAKMQEAAHGQTVTCVFVHEASRMQAGGQGAHPVPCSTGRMSDHAVASCCCSSLDCSSQCQEGCSRQPCQAYLLQGCVGLPCQSAHCHCQPLLSWKAFWWGCWELPWWGLQQLGGCRWS